MKNYEMNNYEMKIFEMNNYEMSYSKIQLVNNMKGQLQRASMFIY